MKIKLVGVVDEIYDGVMALSEHLKFEISESGKTITISKCDVGFFVNVTDAGIEIRYCCLNDFFRAFAIAIDAIKRDERIEISQRNAFETCGMMIDVSRRAVLKVETVKTIMRNMACMGLNRIMLYMEDTYELEKYPYFGYMRGGYNKDEIKEMVRYGNMLGIEMVPCIQTLAHLANMLKWDAFAEVRDTWDVLLAGEDKTYALIEEMIKTMRECFTSSAIHIGMDEANGVGMGRYKEKHGVRDRITILCEHLTKVCEIARKYDFEPMMWSDMLFHLMKKSENGKVPEEVAEMLPEGITQVYWEYYSRSEKFYEQHIADHKRMKRPIVFAGGIWTWSGPSLNYAQTFESTLPALKVCKNNGIKHVFATLWGDDGAECDVIEGLYGMQLYAEINYNEHFTKNQMDKMFEICTGCNAESFALLDSENYYNKMLDPQQEEFTDETRLEGILTFSKQVLYQNPIMGLFDKNFESVDLRNHYTKLYEKIKNMPVQDKFPEIFEYNKQLIKVLSAKSDIGHRLKAAYDTKDMLELTVLSDELMILVMETETLYTMRAALWYKNNKPFGFETVGTRLRGIIATIELAHERVRAFINSEIESIEELEIERMYYNSCERPFVWEFMGGRIMMP